MSLFDKLGVQVVEKSGESLQMLHTGLAATRRAASRALMDRSHRPLSCPHHACAAAARVLVRAR
jgi:hypothetical protein